MTGVGSGLWEGRAESLKAVDAKFEQESALGAYLKLGLFESPSKPLACVRELFVDEHLMFSFSKIPGRYRIEMKFHLVFSIDR